MLLRESKVYLDGVQGTQVPTQAPLAGVYFKPGGFERLDALLTATLGPGATEAQKAKFLRIDYATFWKFKPTRGGKNAQVRHQLHLRLIRRIFVAFPQVEWKDLFEVIEDEIDEQMSAAA